VTAVSPSFSAGFGFESSFMNESNSLSNSSAVFGFFGPGRGGLAPLVRIGPPPRGLRLKKNVRDGFVADDHIAYGVVDPDVFFDSPSLSNRGGFGIEILSISDAGALTT
jgi:hypothetical protein